jgi:hypothetical protein
VTLAALAGADPLHGRGDVLPSVFAEDVRAIHLPPRHEIHEPFTLALVGDLVDAEVSLGHLGSSYALYISMVTPYVKGKIMETTSISADGDRLARYVARNPDKNLRTCFKYGDRSPECVEAQNTYMREYMRNVYRGPRKVRKRKVKA